jgi:hypothetical protein
MDIVMFLGYETKLVRSDKWNPWNMTEHIFVDFLFEEKRVYLHYVENQYDILVKTNEVLNETFFILEKKQSTENT